MDIEIGVKIFLVLVYEIINTQEHINKPNNNPKLLPDNITKIKEVKRIAVLIPNLTHSLVNGTSVEHFF
nr:hypothetical protein [uncultured Methanobrevibacter sp.]